MSMTERNRQLITTAVEKHREFMPFTNTYRVMLEKATIIWDEKNVLTVYPEEGEAFEPQLEEDVVMDLGINISNFGLFLRELGCFADVIR